MIARYGTYEENMNKTEHMIGKIIQNHKNESFEQHYRHHYNTMMSACYCSKSDVYKVWIEQELAKTVVVQTIQNNQFHKRHLLWRCIKDVFMYPLMKLDIKKNIDKDFKRYCTYILDLQCIFNKMPLCIDVYHIIISHLVT